MSHKSTKDNPRRLCLNCPPGKATSLLGAHCWEPICEVGIMADSTERFQSLSPHCRDICADHGFLFPDVWSSWETNTIELCSLDHQTACQLPVEIRKRSCHTGRQIWPSANYYLKRWTQMSSLLSTEIYFLPELSRASVLESCLQTLTNVLC